MKTSKKKDENNLRELATLSDRREWPRESATLDVSETPLKQETFQSDKKMDSIFAVTPLTDSTLKVLMYSTIPFSPFSSVRLRE